MTTITGEENIANVRILALRRALSLELKGLTRRGRSVYSIVKEEFGFKGNKQKVYDQLEKWIDENIWAKKDETQESCSETSEDTTV